MPDVVSLLPSAADLQELRRWWLMAGYGTAALYLLRLIVDYRGAAVVEGVLRETEWSWQLAAFLAMTLAGTVVVLVPVVAFWPVPLAALVWDLWTRSRTRGADRRPPGG